MAATAAAVTPRLPDHPFKQGSAKLAELYVDHVDGQGGYQRNRKDGFINARLRNGFIPGAVGMLSVSRRADRRQFIIDGQQRVELLKALGYVRWPAIFYAGLTRREEADLYTALNQRTNMTAYEMYMAGLAGTDETAHGIEVIMKRVGLQVSRVANQRGHFASVAEACTTYRTSTAHVPGPDLLELNLRLLLKAWGGNPHGLRQEFLSGLRAFASQWGSKADWDALCTALATQTPDKVLSEAAMWHQLAPRSTTSAQMKMALAQAHDTQVRSGKKINPELADLRPPRRHRKGHTDG